MKTVLIRVERSSSYVVVFGVDDIAFVQYW